VKLPETKQMSYHLVCCGTEGDVENPQRWDLRDGARILPLRPPRLLTTALS